VAARFFLIRRFLLRSHLVLFSVENPSHSLPVRRWCIALFSSLLGAGCSLPSLLQSASLRQRFTPYLVVARCGVRCLSSTRGALRDPGC
jgi:hypothetical protein